MKKIIFRLLYCYLIVSVLYSWRKGHWRKIWEYVQYTMENPHAEPVGLVEFLEYVFAPELK